MSRCFPFPPPGYEKKHRPEDLDSLKEEKRKEKKHKKEKKDKERRKDKEKREKDGSDEKYRDKKDKKRKHRDKKEKHREKKKEKNLGKDKDKSSISEESTVAKKLDDRSGENLHQKEHSKDRISFVDEGKGSAPFQCQNGEKPCQNSLLLQGTEESKFVQDLDWRNRDDKMGMGSQLLESVLCTEKRNQQKNSSGVLSDNSKDKRVQSNKTDVQELRNEFSGNTMVQNFTGMAKSRGEGIPKPLDEHKERRLEGKEKFKEMGGKRTDKHKDRDKKSHGKNKEREREKKKKTTKEKTENKKSEQDGTKAVGKSDLGFPSIKSTDLLKDANSSAVSEGNIRKRKDMDTNGFLHDSEARPNKLLRDDSHQLAENGRKIEGCRPPSKSSIDKHGVLNSVQLDNRDLLVNGMIKPQKPSPSRPNTSIAPSVGNHIAEASKGSHPDSKNLKEGFALAKVEDQIAEAKKRPPHPDSKYLNDVLTIPKVDDLSQINEQEWLFNRKDPSNKPKVESFGINDQICVWSEALHIESADVCALPYVVPY